MNLEKFTERSRGFLQAAQTIAMRENHQQLAPEHLLKALMDDEQGLAANLIKTRRRCAASAWSRPSIWRCRRCRRSPATRARPTWISDTAKVLDEAEKIAKKAGDSFVPVERILMALAMVKSKAKDALDAGAVTAQALNSAINDIRKGRTADTAQRRGRL